MTLPQKPDLNSIIAKTISQKLYRKNYIDAGNLKYEIQAEEI